MIIDLVDTAGKPFTARIEMLDVVTVNQAGEVTRKDVYVNGAQRGDAFSRAGLSARRTAGTKFVPQTAKIQQRVFGDHTVIEAEKQANAQTMKNDDRSTTQSVIKQPQLASFQQDASFSEAPNMFLLERRTALVAIGSLVVGACATGGIGRENHLSDTAGIRNKANYLAAKAAFNARDLDSCLAHYAPDHQIMSKPTPPGRKHIRAFFESTFATWPDIQIVVENALAEDDWVMGRSISTATHSATVMGVPATGKKIETSFWDLHRFDEDGLIAQTWNLIDSLTIMQQLGVVP